VSACLKAMCRSILSITVCSAINEMIRIVPPQRGQVYESLMRLGNVHGDSLAMKSRTSNSMGPSLCGPWGSMRTVARARTLPRRTHWRLCH
jgi:hypothetical protein